MYYYNAIAETWDARPTMQVDAVLALLDSVEDVSALDDWSCEDYTEDVSAFFRHQTDRQTAYTLAYNALGARYD